MLEVDQLFVQYEDKLAVNNVSLNIKPGRITGLIGPNGAGKSSLIKSCVGIINEYAGKIKFNGTDIRNDRLRIKQLCGYAPEDTELLPYLKGNEFLELIGSIRKSSDLAAEIDFLISLMGLEDKQNELIINYSHGMRQKISIASSIIGQPEYLFIDEALNGLDPLSLFRLKNHFIELSEAGKTIIISSHILPLIRSWCDPVLIMNKGSIIKSLSVSEIDELEKQNKKDFESIFVKLIEEA